MSSWLASSFWLYCFWQAVRHLWSLDVSGIQCHTYVHPSTNFYPTSWFIQSLLFLTGGEMFLVSIHVWDPPSHRPPPWQERLPDQAVHSDCIVFDRQWDVCSPYACLGYPITQTSTLVEMSTWPDGSFCLCCFWQAVKCFWSLQVSGFPHHTDLHPCRNGYLTNWLILPVLFLTGGETSVVPTRVRNPQSPRPLLQ